MLRIGEREFSYKDIEFVQETINLFPALSRKEIASAICENLDWKNEAKNLKISSCLNLLDKLEKLGKVKLPALRSPNLIKKSIKRALYDVPNKTELGGSVENYNVSLGLAVGLNSNNNWNDLIERYHYLGYKKNFGLHLKYFIFIEGCQHPVGCISVAATSSYQLKCRDELIGWNSRQREANLNKIINNNRFLIFPWIKIENLASKSLRILAAKIAIDWQNKFKFQPVLFETYVDPSKFTGTIYKSSNWLKIGETSGNYRRDKHQELLPKDVYIKALIKNYKEVLCDQKPTKLKLVESKTQIECCIDALLLNEKELNLWEKIQLKIALICQNIDRTDMSHNKKIDALTMLLAIYRIVYAKNFESYSSILCELLDNANSFGIKLSFRESFSASAFCDARKNFPASSLKEITRAIIEIYEEQSDRQDDYLWMKRRIFAVDGSKVNLPRKANEDEHGGYKLPCSHAFYPQGLISCMYRLKSRIAYDYNLTNLMNEQQQALTHLDCIRSGDVVVYDRGYLSYGLLYKHKELGIDGIFRLKKQSFKIIDYFIVSDETDVVVDVLPSKKSFSKSKVKHDFIKNRETIKLRLLKYKINHQEYYLATTIIDEKISVKDYEQAYHARWGHEEFYKSFKHQLKVTEFHGKTEACIKQEIYAGFNILTLNRIMANNIEEKFIENHTNLLQDPFQRQRKVNFKKQLDHFYRIVEPVIAGNNQTQKNVIKKNILRSTQQSYKTRDNRVYDRKSHRHINKWQRASINKNPPTTY